MPVQIERYSFLLISFQLKQEEYLFLRFKISQFAQNLDRKLPVQIERYSFFLISYQLQKTNSSCLDLRRFANFHRWKKREKGLHFLEIRSTKRNIVSPLWPKGLWIRISPSGDISLGGIIERRNCKCPGNEINLASKMKWRSWTYASEGPLSLYLSIYLSLSRWNKNVRQRTRRSFWNRHDPKVDRFIHALWHYKRATQFPVSLCRPQLNSRARRRIFLTAYTRDHVRFSTPRGEKNA